ncbi:MAG: ABC transporter substrate-binding protein [Anaerolineaceae bacterium]|nr:ABC transporter substrate-binding protein [Anaerolineaceae bacterium]
MKKTILIIVILLLALSAGCAAKNSEFATDAPAAAALTKVTLPLGYIPNVQFAPLYVAIEKGFYQEGGIDVDLDYSMENDNAVLLANDTLQFAILSGEQVILARDKQMPLVYVTAWYQQYPVGIVSKTAANITSIADLRGKKIGLPGLYGANYIGAIAMLDSAGLSESDVTLDSIGFNQVEVLMADRVDAVVIYVANEPVQLEAQWESITLLKASDAIDLVSNGLVTNEKTLKENPELVKAMIAATLKGIQYTIDNPDEAYEISKKYVENLASADQAVQKQVLLNSIELWKGDILGYSQPRAWQNMQRILTKMKLLTNDIDVSTCFTNELLP